jgi:hypothetical protein
MSIDTSIYAHIRAQAQRSAQSGLPSAEELAALGAVLCVFRSRYGGELGGWAQSVSAGVRSGIDSDGWHECMQFRDRAGDCCWRLYLLPDTDFFAWEHIQSRLPTIESWDSPIETVASRLWHRLSNRIDGDRWQCSVVRLHALHHPRPSLAASLAPVSQLGADMVRRVARIEGLDLPTPIDDCCSRPRVKTDDGPARGEPARDEPEAAFLQIITLQLF